VWDNAQHADALGKRLPELRAHAHSSEPANARFVAFMNALEEPERPGQTVERLVGMYRVLKPHLVASYQEHLARVNAVYEPPTQRLLLRLVEDERRHVAAGGLILSHLAGTPALEERARTWQARLERLLEAAGGVTGAGLPAAPDVDAVSSAPILNDDAREFIRLEQATGSGDVGGDLEVAVRGLGDALVAQDRAALGRWLAPGLPWGDEAHAQLGRLGARSHRPVALAKVGGQRLVKIKLEGSAGGATILARFVPAPDGWRAAALEVAAVDLARPA
jgi:hypothetical protein